MSYLRTDKLFLYMKMRSSTFTSRGNLNEDQTCFFNFCQVNFVNEWKRCTNVSLHRVIASVQNSIPINYKGTTCYRSNRNCVYYYLSYFYMKWNIFFPLYMRWWMKHSVPHKQQNLPCRICCIWAFSPTHCQLLCCVFSYWSNSCNIKAT